MIKNYKDKSGLWYHNNKYHTPQKSSFFINSSSQLLNYHQISTTQTDNSNIKLKCNYCNKLCSRSDNLHHHLHTCKVRLSNEAKLKEENELKNTEESDS